MPDPDGSCGAKVQVVESGIHWDSVGTLIIVYLGYFGIPIMGTLAVHEELREGFWL